VTLIHRTLLASLLLASLTAAAQTPQNPPSPQNPPQPQTTAPAAQPDDDATTPHGEVLFESHGDPPTTPDNTTAPALQQTLPAGPVLTDAERSALLFTAYDLDARITPETSLLTMRAHVTVRNTGSQPLPRIVLQISSTLTWESVTLITPQSATHLPLTQHLIDTDADHTGKASEAVLTLPSPLAPGAILTLDTLYSGTLTLDATRLERIGAGAGQALDTDWDAISDNAASSSSSDATPSTLVAALRGFGNVLWYPVAAPQLFLGDGAKLFQAVALQRLTDRSATIHLRIAVEYKGDPPTAVYFCGRRQPLLPNPDDPNAPTAIGAGIATADFSTEPLGFRQPSLFIVELPESLIAPLPLAISSSAANPAIGDTPPTTGGSPMLAVESAEPTGAGILPRLAASAQSIAPLLQQWFGDRPLSALTILDHPGDPFEDGPLLIAPIDSLSAASSTSALAHSLTHAWVQTGQPWFDEGLAQFVSLLWTEQQQGRDAALLQLNNLIQPLNIAEPEFDPPTDSGAPGPDSRTRDAAPEPTGQPLIAASDELYFRRKAAAVWWMLRGITGDKPLQQALTAWRTQPFSHDDPAVQAIAFEKLLEKTTGKDLGWFFADWVLRDRGLPDLSIVSVEPRQLPAGKGHDSGWLVAVTMHNAGAPTVDVPLTVLYGNAGAFTTTKRIRIPGFSDITDRIVVEAPPTQVILNDGTIPEIRVSTHSHEVVPQPDQPLL
jgi:hypothetical protein